MSVPDGRLAEGAEFIERPTAQRIGRLLPGSMIEELCRTTHARVSCQSSGNRCIENWRTRREASNALPETLKEWDKYLTAHVPFYRDRAA